MRKLRLLYIIPVVVAVVVAVVLLYTFFSPDQYVKAALAIFLPLIILGIGFRIITYQRIKLIRNQLYQILQTLEAFDVDEPEPIEFEESPFPIFNELNEYLIELINRVRTNYTANKQFTQNASHELQTPLAIIKGHVELLLQSSNLGEKEIKSLATVLQNTNRLSKLNSALILLSKIEHQRFTDTDVIDFKVVIEEVLQNFNDLIQMQGLTIQWEESTSFPVEMSETLAEILVANLLQNAIRHNVTDGYIKIKVNPHSLMIENPGKPLEQPVTTIFKRFKRESDVEESLGLGLSIVQRICEQSGLEVRYEQEGEEHRLWVGRNE